ncbi:MAG: M12 family metallo-peptidase [Acidobacteria bacterium]|nr:M12 family metallo-peptidase [Acidobacteriota bacterium]
MPVAARESRRDLFAVALIVVLKLLPVPAASQTLFRIVDDAPLASVVGEEVDAAGLAQRAFIVDIDIELLRSGLAELRLPTPDGRELAATLSTFEDRGGGNVLWRGRLGGEELDGVVLTVEDGILVGRFGDGEGSYRIKPGVGGQALLKSADGPLRCAAESAPGEPSSALLPGLDRPQRAVAAATTATIDVLALYTPTAAARMGGAAGMRAAIRNAGDYLNTAFSNSEISAMVRIVHIAPAPADLASTDTVPLEDIALNLTDHAGVRALRQRHRADLVHLFIDQAAEGRTGACGWAWVLERHHTVALFSPYGYAVTRTWCDVDELFAHEVGHNLGANHVPSNSNLRPEEAVRPYAFAYNNLAERVHTVTSQGTDTTFPVAIFSLAGNSGATVGVAGRQENARALRATVDMASRYSDVFAPPSGNGAPAAPTELTGYATSESSVHLTWKDNSTSEDTFEVLRAPTLAPRNVAFSGSRIRSVRANTVQVDLTGLSPGYYAFAVRARNAAGASETSNSIGFYLPRDPCEETETGTCLQRGRFDVWLHFGTDEGTGHGKVKRVDLGDASTLMYFFDESNVEMLIKILDGCRINNRFWVFAAAATDLEYYLYVWDTTTGVAAIYYNSPGTAPRAVTDTRAFATCDR